MKFALLSLLLLACQPVLAAAAGPSAPPSGVIVAVDPLRPVQDVNADGTTFLQEDAGVPSAGVPSAGVPSAEPSGARLGSSLRRPALALGFALRHSLDAGSVRRRGLRAREEGGGGDRLRVENEHARRLAPRDLRRPLVSDPPGAAVGRALPLGELGPDRRVIGGCLAGLISYLADAPTGGEILLYVLAGPGVIGLNEVIKLFGDPSQKKRAS